jgi:hypothetical protein
MEPAMRRMLIALLTVALLLTPAPAVAEAPPAEAKAPPAKAKAPPAEAKAPPAEAKAPPAEAKAPADEPSKPPEKAPPAEESTPLDHKYQFGLGVRSGTGYRVIMPYHEENCGEVDKSVCGGRQPFWIELSPSFGITRSLELLVDVRLVLEQDISLSRGFFISPGIKYYTDPEDLFKFFFTGQVVFESQKQTNVPSLKTFDIGVRSALGIQFDVLRYLGLYLQGGIIVGFNRWLTFVVDAAVGLQVRY